MNINKRERILRMLDGERKGEVFCSCNLTAVTWDVMDKLKVYWPDAYLDPNLMVILGESQHTLLGFDSVRSGFDNPLESQALGAEVNMGSREGQAYVTKPAFDNPDSFNIPSNLFELGRFPVHFKALSILRDKYINKGTVPIYALQMGPMTNMGNLFGVERLMRWTRKDPVLFKELLEKVANIVAQYANLLIENGADALSIADPTASLNLISPKVFENFVFPVYRWLSQEIKGRIILHICGDTAPILGSILETGFCAFSFEGPTVKVKKVKEVFGDQMALFGNIPTIDVLMNGTVDVVKRAVMNAIEEGVDSVAPACAFPLQTPIENQRAMAEVVREFNRAKGFDNLEAN